MRQFGWSLATAIALTTALAGCGTGPVSSLVPNRQAASLQRSSVPTDVEKALIKDLGTLAGETLAFADATYSALKLDTAAGRKLTPKKEPMLQEGLRPLVARFEADTQAMRERLEAAGTPKLLMLARELDLKGPSPGDVLPAAASASDMLYRIAQYRLKFGHMVEYAHKKGVMPQTPTWKDRPASDKESD